MVLPLYLAGTREEILSVDTRSRIAWLEARFSADTPGLSDLPDALPPGAMLILTDRVPCEAHDPEQVTRELGEAVARLGCESVLLDLERPPTERSQAMAQAISEALPCPVAAPPGYLTKPDSPIFLPPAPLHIPLETYLRPWRHREIWLEAALLQQTIAVGPTGTAFSPAVPADRLEGFHDQRLCCRFCQELQKDLAVFTLFDTPETLTQKLDRAADLGITRAVGLYQELIRSTK